MTVLATLRCCNVAKSYRSGRRRVLRGGACYRRGASALRVVGGQSLVQRRVPAPRKWSGEGLGGVVGKTALRKCSFPCRANGVLRKGGSCRTRAQASEHKRA